MKKLLVLSFLILLLSGCSIVNIENQTLEEIIDATLTSSDTLKSVSFEGYSYYLPQHVNLSSNDGGNSILYYNHRKMYLYVDLISYYHQVTSTYSVNNDAYFSMAIDINGNQGYLEITELSNSNNYFVEFMYHYSKIEAYVDKDDLKRTVTVMGYILNSVDINDSVVESLIGDNALNYSEEQFNIFKPEVESDYLDYIEQYDDARLNSKDEDVLDLDEDLE